MTQPTKTWKHVEAEIAKFFPHGKRRGADFRNRERGGGKNDVITSGYSIEIKHSKRPSWGLIADAIDQAIAAKEDPGDIPLAVIHKEGTEYGNSLVVMKLSDFREFFINQPADPK